MRSPEELAREWLAERGLTRDWPVVNTAETELRASLADLIRQRDAEHEALRRASGWVPVSEGVPEFGVPVLVYAEGELMVCKRFDPGDEGGWFWMLRTSLSGFTSPRGVTHWQPIAPPSLAGEPATKEEGDG